MARFLFYLGNHFFDLIHLLFHFLISFNSGFRNYTRPKVQPIVPIFDLGLLSW
jgi:hypothetical protein